MVAPLSKVGHRSYSAEARGPPLFTLSAADIQSALPQPSPGDLGLST
jgi:hypothetical protein